MATYKGIQGYSIQKLSNDPPAAQSVGQLWYNSSSGKFKIGTAGAGSWASGGALTAVIGSNKGFGINTAAVSTGGVSPSPAPATTIAVEKYNGTTWSGGNSLNTGRSMQGSCGITTAGMVMGGMLAGGSPNTDKMETYDGTNWSEGNDLQTPRGALNGSGSTTAALAIGGYNPPPALQLDISETWNGTSWASANTMNTRRSSLGNAQQSPSTDTIAFGGYSQPPPNTANAETWNGTTWAETADLNTAKDNMGGTGNSSTNALCYGGRTIATTEKWDGTSWTEVADLSLARGYGSSAGASSGSALMAGGEAPGAPYYKNNTEEWTDPIYTIKTVTVS